ncbi:acetyl-CoA acyltransferase [Halorubrum salipaludis]|uniref:Acetyl-CoA acyltransferase n=1 Tax=Halorubrum salipaludis TaxID=2032630 RepID=A0A2A2FBU1_9EURY|nr:acetyl-CoA acyltransferase [Halorubrum salipaludis]PAU82926.1 acetyl-CoA acyltransferase [Halorubrum salipaludis]
MTGVAISGVGMTEFRAAADASILELAAAAADRALADSRHSREEVASLHVSNALAESLGTRAGVANALASAIGVEGASADRIENTSASGASACHRGVEAVGAGGEGVALVVGVEKMSVRDTPDVTESISRLVHDREYRQGLTLPSFGGLAAGAYLDRYDAPRESLAAVAAKNHRNARANPFAQFQKAVTVEDALDSPVVADPLRLYDCCPMTDGAAAVVLSPEETVPDEGSVRIEGIGSATGTHAVAERDDPLAIESVRTAGERAFDRAGLAVDDVDVACIHDAFTILELLELEELGFYDPGTAWEATLDGETALDGSLPVNPGGGLKARGHPLGATGLSQIVELVWQLRGDLPDERQVPDPEVGFAINVAGFGNNSVCTVVRHG